MGSTTKTPSGTALESGGAESVMFSAGYVSNEALQKCRTWVRRTGREPVRGGVRETPRAAAGPVAPNATQSKTRRHQRLNEHSFKIKVQFLPEWPPDFTNRSVAGLRLNATVFILKEATGSSTSTLMRAPRASGQSAQVNIHRSLTTW